MSKFPGYVVPRQLDCIASSMVHIRLSVGFDPNGSTFATRMSNKSSKLQLSVVKMERVEFCHFQNRWENLRIEGQCEFNSQITVQR